MTIKTGDKPNAGTDANVYFSLHGDKGETPRIGLQDESQTFRRFERARADKFVVQTADVGKVTQSNDLGECHVWDAFLAHSRCPSAKRLRDEMTNFSLQTTPQNVF